MIITKKYPYSSDFLTMSDLSNMDSELNNVNGNQSGLSGVLFDR